MDFVTARDLKVNTGQVWEKLKGEKDLVVTLNGKPIAILSGIRGENLEQILNSVRQARGIAAMRSIQKQAVERGLDKMTMKEIDEVIRKTRQEMDRARRS